MFERVFPNPACFIKDRDAIRYNTGEKKIGFSNVMLYENYIIRDEITPEQNWYNLPTVSFLQPVF